uniref:DNA topoisomerase n=1 Tax=Dermatophagoides pteronyssinus TaxID=6956 RepID=A0A6P6XQ23_DERPT|nr:DNA topoisomerase 3-like [Dermatophagoides pteronyssinus]
MIILNITEKPSVAQIKQIDNCELIFTSLSGHLLKFDFQLQTASWFHINPYTLFYTKTIKTVISDHINIFKNLLCLLSIASRLYIWTDADNEGENIAYNISEIANFINSNLIIKRIRFNVIQEKYLISGLNNLSTINKRVAYSIDVQHRLDLIVGSTFTRALTLFFINQLKNKNLVSYGPCQYPTLGFISRRFTRILNFDQDILKFQHHGAKSKIFDLLLAIDLSKKLIKSKNCRLTKVQKTETTHKKPIPLDTTTLCANINKIYKIPSSETMKIAEKLYIQSLISYPRTDTQVFRENGIILESLEAFKQDNNYQTIINKIITKKSFLSINNGVKNDLAHLPIYPVKPATNLSKTEFLIFNYIIIYFLAVCDEDAILQSNYYEITLNNEIFYHSNKNIKFKGFLDFFPFDSLSQSETNFSKVDLNKNDLVSPTKYILTASVTSRPSLMSEYELIYEMEKFSIGTDATMYDHIATVQKRSFMKLVNKNCFIPTKYEYIADIKSNTPLHTPAITINVDDILDEHST